MDQAVSAGKARRRPLRRIALAAALILLGAAPLANLILAGKPARTRIAGLIQRRSGLDCTIDGASLTPWHGFELRGLRLLQPPALRKNTAAHLLEAETVRLSPVWKSWIRGRLEIHAIAVDSPVITIPTELLADLTKPRPGPPPAAESQPDPARPSTQPTPPLAEAPPPATPDTAKPPPSTAAAKHPPTAWLHIRNGSASIVSTSRKTVIASISGMTGSIPIAGGPAASGSRAGPLSIGGRTVLTEIRPELAWNPPFLTATARDADLLGHRASFQCSAALVRGLPMQIEAAFPEQPLAETQGPGNVRARSASLTASARFRGFLLASPTWQGEFAARANAPAGHLAGHYVAFDRGHCLVLLRGGILSCTDARLVGDELSLLGNATLLADGRLAAVLRVVAPPDSLSALATRLLPNIPTPAFTALSTPQRAAFDLEASGDIRQILVRPAATTPLPVPQR